MKNFLKYFKFFLLVSIPLVVLVFSYFNEETNQEKHSYSQYYENNKEKAQQLLKEYHARVFDCANYGPVLSNPALLDSTIINFAKRGNSFYIKTLVKTNCGKKFYASLKCPQKLFEEYKNSKSNHAYLIASINKISESTTIAEADSLDGKTKNICIENSVMLSGNCIAYTEIPEYSPIY